MDLLTDLLNHEGDYARREIYGLLDPSGPAVRPRFNIFEVEVNHEKQQLTVWDVLDGDRLRLVITTTEARQRLV